MSTVLIILIILWLLGFLRIPGLPILHREIVNLFGHSITLWEILIFIVIMWAMESLPTPLRQIAYVLVLLWVLSLFNIIAITGLSNLIVLALIIGLVVALFQKS